MSPWERIYLSPHFDDAVFSCGGTIHRQRRAGKKVLVITVFSAAPDENAPLSTLAEGFHRHMDSGNDPVAIRRREDTEALNRLGASFRHFDFKDAVYRMDRADGQWLYSSLEEIFGPVHSRDADLSKQIAARIEAIALKSPSATLCFPAAIGNHVDHQLVHRAGLIMADRNLPVHFYEDYPYADPAAMKDHPACVTPDQTGQRLSLLGKKEFLSRIREPDFHARVEAMTMYRSQLQAYPDPSKVVSDHLRGFLERKSPKGLAERFWN